MNHLVSNPENSIFDAKRLIGREFKDHNVQADMEYWPFSVIENIEKYSKPHIQVKVNGHEKLFAPEEISAMVLGKMKETAEAYLGKKQLMLL